MDRVKRKLCYSTCSFYSFLDCAFGFGSTCGYSACSTSWVSVLGSSTDGRRIKTLEFSLFLATVNILHIILYFGSLLY
jgi:hypothetical protein